MSFGQKKRHASEALEEMLGVDSPASKRSRVETGTPSPLGLDEEEHEARNGDRREGGADSAGERDGTRWPMERLRISEERHGPKGGGGDDDNNDNNDNDDDDDEVRGAAPIRQSAPTAGYDDLYLDTIDRNVLDFDFEKLCSVSLSNINVYACLVCGRYYQGRGPRSHAYFHALDDDHHVFINMQTQKVYVLPEGYEVLSSSLDDIKYVSDPRYTRAEVAALDRRRAAPAWTLAGREYAPGFVGMNNIKENDYVNVVVQALAHVPPLRNFLLLEDLGGGGGGGGGGGNNNNSSQTAELVRRCSTLMRKIWNPRAFKAHVSPHELLQEVSLLSNKRFTLTAQSDPVDFLSWFLNNLHLGLGGSRTRPGSSMVQRVFQGRVKVESQAITAKADAFDRLRFEDAAEVKVDVGPFLLLTLDLPPAPLFQGGGDDEERSIIPQVPLTSILAKYDGVSAQEHLNHRRRYRLMHPLPPYLILHVKRFSRNKFVSERNPTIVTFDPRGLDVAPYVEPDPALHPPGEPVLYDLVANVVHEAVKAKDDVADSSEERKTWKVQLRDRARDEWVVCQDLFVDKIRDELLYLGETYLQVWERRRDGKRKGRAA
ncbi:U4/U6.U5 tri-snRNP-associated protein 2 [Gaeumannomyces tritici R3-111a-1]|uniref:U4/U6.U5 tri-snRNP-associated protein 2 n=1 Tax=Gaeumannomyces tritici (strain R3-111a-1) TaxID=644352 RepID=J3NGW0_GAET3|nr:U4/U6.U5 tri-snRNP-associated protein 2 [Gaeumannomyces tritici R3-111a-1]EJT80500.1 U4/U6.U5 tri-snRNP-associated protein 2 [Gaeumannomyces tritici R3-111a-1]